MTSLHEAQEEITLIVMQAQKQIQTFSQALIQRQQTVKIVNVFTSHHRLSTMLPSACSFISLNLSL
jgi:hypothetical protein